MADGEGRGEGGEGESSFNGGIIREFEGEREK